MYGMLRPLLFRLDPERAHRLVVRGVSMGAPLATWWGRRLPDAPVLRQRLWDREFPHPVGLAAGLDKNGEAINAWLAMGFSFIEIGTVTPRPQPGNPKPRLFRLPEDEALINRMGFNNAGAAAVRRNLLARRRRGLVGVNLGKNKTTPNEAAASDYLAVLEAVHPLADYLVINVSSPNTPGLRDLQAESELIPLVRAVLERRDALHEVSLDRIQPHRPPVLVKLAPDLADDTLIRLAKALMDAGVDGLIATNTTIARPNLRSRHRDEPGGLSGRPLCARSTAVIRLLYRATEGRLPIIGSGGVMDADSAYEKILAGASLLQVYTGLIYRGPALIRDIVTGLEARLARDGFSHLRDAVGAGAQ
ncbi:MAG: quinone-dependent dihydroorotate dehydrogenase [Thermoflavifilum sp.]|nr:quinone-dependent dihydroorotate dehydrogenase [Thermoflavifilum sp.]MCL6514881.1 quinone-dependent dihydroorotate dehydrogenase [Alicyclobacillus sp.]